MVDVMQKALSWLEAQRVAYRSVPVVYTRGLKKGTLNATIGQSQFDLDDGGGTGGMIRFESRDYLFAATELWAAGIAFPPRPGDRVTDSTMGNGTPLVYELVNPSPTIPAWRWSDRFHTRLRVHTVLASKEVPHGA